MGFADRRRVSLRPLLRALVTVVAPILGLEAVARVASPWPERTAIPKRLAHSLIFQPDRELGRVPRAMASHTFWSPEWQSTVSINALGMRGPRPARPQPGAARVLALGDSMTFAMQVEDADTWVRRLETILSETRPTSVWNAGVDSYGTHEALGRAQRELERGIHFDAIVLTVFLGNDLSDNAKDRTKRKARGGHPVSGAPEGTERASQWVSLAWAELMVERWRSSKDDQFAKNVAVDFAPWCDDHALDAVLPKTLVPLDALRSLARAHDVPLVIALAPPQWVVNPELGQETADWLGLEGFDPTRVPHRLRAALHPSIPVVDLTDPLQAAARDGPVTWRLDGHWNPRGHAAVAEAIAPALQEVLQPAAEGSAYTDVVGSRRD